MTTTADIVKAIQSKRTSDVKNKIDSENRRVDFFRTPFTMTTKKRQAESRQKTLVFRCNPSEAAYSFAQRGGTQDVKSGKVFYFWKNKKKKTHWDLPTITWTFQSGNIRPMIEEGNETYLPEGLDNFYEFMSIIDEDKILADGSPNLVVITHHSHVFPSVILEGFFDPSEAVSFNESAADAPMITWQKTFFIHRSTPSFNSEAFGSIFVKSYTESYKADPGKKNKGSSDIAKFDKTKS